MPTPIWSLCLAALAMLACTTVSAAPQTLVSIDGSVPGEQINDVDPVKGKEITGTLAKGLHENSGWMENVRLQYSMGEEAGRAFCRVEVKQGSAQLQLPLGDAYREDGYYRLQLEFRGSQQATMGLSMRLDGPPYDTLWTTDAVVGESWTKREWRFRVGKKGQPFGLYLRLGRPETIDLAKLTLIKESREDLIAEAKAKYPDGGEPRNRLNVTRFPLGPQSGWGLDRDYSDDQFTVAADPKVTGPSGSPALKLASPAGKPMVVCPAPVDLPWSFQKHTISLAARGSGTLELRMFSDTSQWDSSGVASKEFRLTDQWQRVSLTFDPIFMGALHQLRLRFSGTAWIDAMQLVPGEQDTAYAPRLPYEVALACPKSDASIARIQFTDEPAVLDYAVTGTGTTAPVLKAKAVNVYGQEKPLPAVTLSKEALQKGQLRFDLFPDKPLGPVRIEAWVEDGAGKMIGSPNEILVLRLHRPRYWGKDAPNSPFGTHMNSSLRHIVLSKAIGMNWTRLHDAGTQYVGWSFVEPEKGKWTFFDEDIARYRKGNIQILGTLATSPGWASTFGGTAGGYWDRWVRPEDPEAWGNYVKTVTSRYKGAIDAWEIWNEPWGTFWSVWDHATKKNIIPPDAVQSYAKIAEIAYSTARDANPNVTIVGINTIGSWTGPKWTTDVVAAGAAETCDVYSYHQYTSEFPGALNDSVEREYANALKPLLAGANGTPNKPVWMSEGNPYEGLLGRGMLTVSAPGKYQEDVDHLSDQVVRYGVRLLSKGVKRYFMYTMHHHGLFRAGPTPYAVCVTDDGAVHPIGAAYAQMAWELEDTQFAKRIEVVPGLHAYLFEGKGRSVAALISVPGAKRYTLTLPAGGAIHDLYGNDVTSGTPYAGRMVYISAPTGIDALEKTLVSR